MTTAAITGEKEFLRVERIFAATWDVAHRRFAAYFALTLVFGVMPNLVVAAVSGVPLAAIGTAPLAVKLATMALFIAADSVLTAALARLTLADLAGGDTGLKSALSIPPRLLPAFLLVAIATDVPVLALNLIANLSPHGPAVGLVLYGLRFAVGVTVGAVFCGAAAVVAAEGLSAGAALKRAAALTRGHRARTGLFFAAFFVLKVLGPYLLIDTALSLAMSGLPRGGATDFAFALVSAVIWNLLACSLAVATTLIYAELKAIRARQPL